MLWVVLPIAWIFVGGALALALSALFGQPLRRARRPATDVVRAAREPELELVITVDEEAFAGAKGAARPPSRARLELPRVAPPPPDREAPRVKGAPARPVQAVVAHLAHLLPGGASSQRRAP
jgi:hypothetical protein